MIARRTFVVQSAYVHRFSIFRTVYAFILTTFRSATSSQLCSPFHPPDGAPAKASDPGTPLPAPDADRKYEYLWNCREYLDKASKFVLATDSDEPGQALAEELARRLGREKCWRVKWPLTSAGQPVKDANEALMRMGKSGVREAVEGAEAFPIRGLFKFESFFEEIDDYYHLQLGDERGVSTGEEDVPLL